MAGRNKGKSSMSFPMEQLGFSKGEILPKQVLQPSPSYPPLEHKPLPIQMTTEISYLVELKRAFAEYMRESPNNVQAVILKKDIERYCEDYDEAIIKYDRLECESKHDWSKMPMELKLSRKRKMQQQSTKPNKKRKMDMDIEKKLMELEKNENSQRLDTEEEIEEEEDEDEQDKMSERVKDEEELDEEMDDGTDYANDYFDTGENYCSEDDNDDGPVFGM